MLEALEFFNTKILPLFTPVERAVGKRILAP
jgi:hypothetical protein